VVTVAQRKALRPQSCLLLSVPLDVPLNPAAHRIGGSIPCINHFFTGRGRLDAMPLHVVCNFCVVACHNRSVLSRSVALPEFDAVRTKDASVSQDENIIFETVAATAEEAALKAWFHF
jgi:hypothetical protein